MIDTDVKMKVDKTKKVIGENVRNFTDKVSLATGGLGSTMGACAKRMLIALLYGVFGAILYFFLPLWQCLTIFGSVVLISVLYWKCILFNCPKWSNFSLGDKIPI